MGAPTKANYTRQPSPQLEVAYIELFLNLTKFWQDCLSFL
jgi:hypothetical protein